jgi:predicted RNase H-like HicB family nuclease
MMKVKTSFSYPPIPSRDWDWVAFIEGEEDGPTGHGETEEGALRMLAEELAVLWVEAL